MISGLVSEFPKWGSLERHGKYPHGLRQSKVCFLPLDLSPLNPASRREPESVRRRDRRPRMAGNPEFDHRRRFVLGMTLILSVVYLMGLGSV
jgi:hypothetical protein